MKTILVVGKSLSRLRSYLDEHDYQQISLLDNRHHFAHTNNLYHCDFASTDSITETVNALSKSHAIDGIITTYENYILPTARIAKMLNKPGLSLESAKACTDKEIMRTKFSQAIRHISPDFQVVNSKKDLLDFASGHKFPLILKPANLSKSLLVTKVSSTKELLDVYDKSLNSLEATYQKYAPNRRPKLIIEEFISGSIHSVEAFADSKGEIKVLHQVVDYEVGYDVGYKDNFHYSRTLPSKLDQSTVDDIRKVAEIGCKSLGLTNSPAHVEIILSDKGPMIVEIGARVGGYRERMHLFANGIDLTGCALNLATGKAVDIKAIKNDPCVVLELFPKVGGIFESIANLKELQKLRSLVYFSQKVNEGDFIGLSSEGYKTCAVIILHNPNKQEFAADYSFVRQNVSVKTKN